MSIQYNSQYVDEKYLPIVEPNLFVDTVLIPGVTYTDKYEVGPAGQLYVHKLTKANTIVPGAPGRDFSHEASADTLIPIALNNNYMQSKKMYGVQINAVSFALADENLSEAIAEVREGRQYSGLACLAEEGTDDTDTTAITTSSGAEAKLIELRKLIRKKHGKANFALVNTDVYALFLELAGLKIDMDPATKSGELLQRFGMNIIECDGFDLATAKYINSSGTTKTVDLTDVEMIVGDYRGFSMVDNFESMRVVDGSPNFNGSCAQVEVNSGFKVTNADLIVVKKV